MTKERTVYVTCPICRAMIEVNAENGTVVRHFEPRARAGADDTLAEGLKAVKSGEAARDEKFRAAREQEKSKMARIEDLFREKQREVEKSGDTGKPLRPIDLD